MSDPSLDHVRDIHFAHTHPAIGDTLRQAGSDQQVERLAHPRRISPARRRQNDAEHHRSFAHPAWTTELVDGPFDGRAIESDSGR